MKKILFGIFFVIIVLSCKAQNTNTEELIARNQEIDSSKVVEPDALHSKINRIISTVLEKAHYKKFNLNDSLSSVIFNNYLKVLDNNKLYFLKEDIDSFEKHRDKFDDYLKSGNLHPAFDIFNIYKSRLGERVEYILKRLENEFDYSADEYIQPDRSEEGYTESLDELNELWRKRLKNDALNAKLNGDDWDKISSTLSKRFMYFHKTILKYDAEDVFQLYMNAFSAAVEPHTTYFSPITAQNFGINMSLSLEGIGAQLVYRNDYTTITRIIPGGPAEKSGRLDVDDRIVGVGQGKDGEIIDVVGWRLDDVIQLIRGKKGTVVRLMIEKADSDPNLPAEELVLTRDKIKLEDQAAKSDIININNNGKEYRLGVIDIPGFYMDVEGRRSGDLDYKSTTRDVNKLLAELQEKNVDGVIIDLRSNGGGSLQEAISLTGLFIENGPVVQVRNTDGTIDMGRDRDPSIAYDGPLAVMVNRSSASASEIFAAAIQDYGRGLVIGSQSYGKGTVQNLIDLERFMPSKRGEVGQVKMTVAKFYRVTGSSTQLKGVEPDIDFPSALLSSEFGEASQESALPWDTITPANYAQYGDLQVFIPELEKKHEDRIAGSVSFQNYLEDVAEAIRIRENNSYPLNEEKRKKQRDEAEVKRKKREEERAARNELLLTGDEEVKKDYNRPDDPILEETGQILADYITMKIG